MGSPFDDFLLWERASRDTIDFKKIYVDMAGGDVLAGLVLSQIVYWHSLSSDSDKAKLRVGHDEKFWIAVRRHEWWEQSRLSPRQIDRAFDKLIACGLCEKAVYRYNGAPTVHVRLVEKEFLVQLGELQNSPIENPFAPEKDDWQERKRKPEYCVYVLVMGQYHKIGRTQNITKRLREIRSVTTPWPIDLVLERRCDSYEQHYKLETALHHYLEDYRIRNTEWFDLPDWDVEHIAEIIEKVVEGLT